MNFLHTRKFDLALDEYIKNGKMVYGICLGFQLLFDISYENGEHKGLGFIHGKVTKFNHKSIHLKVPHMGWNNIYINNTNSNSMFRNIIDKERFYFVHSYYAIPLNSYQSSSHCIFGVKFCSSITYKNIWGSQFHPEKSGDKGLQILRNFINEVNKLK
jgi:glutamine amidotransferase